MKHFILKRPNWIHFLVYLFILASCLAFWYFVIYKFVKLLNLA